MGRLARETAGNEEARQGLRKAVADYVNLRFIGNTEAATSQEKLIRSDRFQEFVKLSAPALKQVFGDDEVRTLAAIAADLSRSNRTAKLPGRSNTVQDLLAVNASGGESWLSRLLSPGALASAGAAAGSPGGWIGSAAGAGLGAHFGRVIEAMRKTGLASVDDIVKDAMLNPDRARALLAKVSDAPTPQEALSLAQAYIRASLLPGSDAPTPQGRGKMGDIFGVDRPARPILAPPAPERRSSLDGAPPSHRAVAEAMLSRGIPVHTYSPGVEKVAREMARRRPVGITSGVMGMA